jgi:hypothetical protein
MKTKKSAAILACAIGGLLSHAAQAQSLCDLLPAATVKAALNIKEPLVAVPDTEWGNGCDYSTPQGGQPVVEALASDDIGMDSIALTNHVASLNDDDQLVKGIGEAAIYTKDAHDQDPSTPSIYYNRQSLIFRTDKKIVDFVVMTNGDTPRESDIIALGKLLAAQPIDSMKDPSN